MIYLKAYTRLNLGDDLFIKKICDNHKKQKFCIIADKKYKKVFKNTKNLKVMSYSYDRLEKRKNNTLKYQKEHNKILKRISNKCDTYVYIGGSIFIEKEKNSIDRVMQLKKEISYFKNSYIIGANFGPYMTKKYLEYVHNELIPSLNYISFRDIDSYNLFKDLKNVIYAPDILFSLPVTKQENKTKELGISLINHLNREELKKNYDEYQKQLINLSIDYIKKGYQIRLLSFCSYEKDPIAINDYLEKIPKEYKKNIIVDYYQGNIEEFLERISNLDTIIATRFHSIVLGLKYCCKVIPICYSNKAINLLNDLNIKEYTTFKSIKKLSIIKPTKITTKQLKVIEEKAQKHFNLLNLD